MSAITEVSIPATHAPAKTGEQLRSVIDGNRLRALAKLPDSVALRDGLGATLRWFRDAVGER